MHSIKSHEVAIHDHRPRDSIMKFANAVAVIKTFLLAISADMIY